MNVLVLPPEVATLDQPLLGSFDRICKAFDMSPATCRRRIADTPDFPQAVNVGGMKRWVWKDVLAYIDNLSARAAKVGVKVND